MRRLLPIGGGTLLALAIVAGVLRPSPGLDAGPFTAGRRMNHVYSERAHGTHSSVPPTRMVSFAYVGHPWEPSLARLDALLIPRGFVRERDDEFGSEWRRGEETLTLTSSERSEHPRTTLSVWHDHPATLGDLVGAYLHGELHLE